MGWYLRKSLGLGPLRINLSRSGLGASVGVRGLRVGMGPRGRYLHAGRDGLYYRTSLEEPAAPAAAETDEDAAAPSTAEPGRNQFGMRLIRGFLGWLRRDR